MRTVVTAIIIFLTAFRAFAYRREFIVTLAGARKAGSEVCFYDGKSGRDPFDLFFSFALVKCLPADKVLDLPPGLFHVFARHADGFVSSHRDYFVYRGKALPEVGYSRLEIPLQPAAVLDFSEVVKHLKPGQTLGVWVAPTPNVAGTFLPLVEGERTSLVPAESIVVPLLVAEHRPIAAGDALYLTHGTVENVSRLDNRVLVAWVRPDGGLLQRVQRVSSPPEIVVFSGGQIFKPLYPLYASTGVENTLLFFENMREGLEGQVEVRGRFWENTRAPISIQSSTVTLVEDPIVLRPAGAIAVTWQATEETAKTRCQIAGKDDPPKLRLTLKVCPKPSECKTLAVADAALRDEATTFEGVPEGKYTVVARGAASTVTTPAIVQLGEMTRVNVTLPGFNLFGAVTVNSVPVQAHLSFASGEVDTDESGHYTARLFGDPGRAIVQVVLCDGRFYKYIPDVDVAANAVLDIDIRVRQTKVRVLGPGRKALDNASVRYAVLKDQKESATTAIYTGPPRMVDAKGVTVLDLPSGRAVVVCGKNALSVEQCSEPFVDRDEIELTLNPFAQAGRVISHEGRGFIAAVDPQGRTEELVVVDPDGTFGFRTLHRQPSYFVYTAERQPLSIIPIPADQNPEYVSISPPAARVRSFIIRANSASMEGAFVGLWFGNNYVPLQMLAFHQEARGLDVAIAHQRLWIRDVASNQQISIALAKPGSADPPDIFVLPQYAGIQRHVVGEAEVSVPP